MSFFLTSHARLVASLCSIRFVVTATFLGSLLAACSNGGDIEVAAPVVNPSALIAVSAEPAGAQCALGGHVVKAGPDTNTNTVLDVAEVSSTQFVCTGTVVPGATVSATGANSLALLVATSPEAAGVNCTFGGQRVAAGLDVNTNGVLDTAEVTATRYACNSTNWVNATSTSVQVQANTSYMANNAAQVSITLPTSPTVGDTFTVNGVGAGGWKITQNDGQAVQAPSFIPNTINGQVFQARESSRTWSSVATSADGSKLVAAASGGQLYTSSDSGVTWTARESSRNWFSVASSADGIKLVAAAYNGQLYTSSDSGVTWTARESNRTWSSVASSADGNKLVAAAVFNGQLYTSSDSGVTWTARESNRYWRGVASSADGNKLAAAAYGGQLYVTQPATTTLGTAGFLSGAQNTSVTLQYLGNGLFKVLSYVGSGITGQ